MAMEMDSGVVIMLVALFVLITSVFIILMLMLPEWFGISKNKSPQVERQSEQSSQSDA